MPGYKASYIITKDEMLFLLSNSAQGNLTKPAEYIIKQYLTDASVTPETIEGLVYKQLARKDGGKLALEPVLDLIVKTIFSAQKIWDADETGNGRTTFVIQTRTMVLHIQDYPLAERTLKVSPYANMRKLKVEVKWLGEVVKDFTGAGKLPGGKIK